MNRAVWIAALTTIAIFVAGSIAWGQNRFGGGGMGGTSGFGGGGMGGMSGFGGGGMGGMSGMGNSAFGRSGFGGGMGGNFGGGFGGGGSGFGNSAFGRGGGFGNSGFGGSGFGGQGMYGGGMGGQNFVGRDGGDMQAIMGQMGRAGTQFFNNMNRNMGNRNNRNRQQPGQDDENERPPVRVRLEVGFPAPQAASTAVAANLNARITQLARDHNLGQVQITAEGDTVVLRGAADSEVQRRVLERFVMLEPGVMSVRNEMVVAGATIEEPLPVSGN